MKASLLYYLLKIKRKKSIKFARDVASKIDTNHVHGSTETFVESIT